MPVDAPPRKRGRRRQSATSPGQAGISPQPAAGTVPARRTARDSGGERNRSCPAWFIRPPPAKSGDRRHELAPAIHQAFDTVSKQVFADGALPAKTKHLIAVAAAHVT